MSNEFKKINEAPSFKLSIELNDGRVSCQMTGAFMVKDSERLTDELMRLSMVIRNASRMSVGSELSDDMIRRAA